jgi:hypothetical protein
MPIWGPVWVPIDSKRDNPLTSGWEAQYRGEGGLVVRRLRLIYYIIS